MKPFEKYFSPYWCSRSGFTIAELLVASVASSVIFIGIYSIFMQATQAEENIRLQTQQRRAVIAVAEHIARTLEYAINLPDIPSIEGGAEGDGEHFLKCTVAGIGVNGGDVTGRSISRIRYSWGQQDIDSNENQIYLQKMPYGGSKLLLLTNQEEQQEEEELWSQIPKAVIGTQLRSVSLLYRSAANPDASWQDNWKGSAGEVAIKIRVSVGGETAERIVIPKVNAPIIQE